MLKVWAYIAQDAREPADALIAEFHQKFALIADFPEIGPKRDHLAQDLRALPCGRYVIYYICSKSALFVVRVLHGSRDTRTLFEL